MAEGRAAAPAPAGEWLVEEGIGEHRAVLIRDGAVIAARMDWPGSLAAGQIEDARLIARAGGSARGTVRFASGEEAQVDALPREASEGASLRVEVTRAAIIEPGGDGPGRRKLARCRPCAQPPRPAPTLLRRCAQTGLNARKAHRLPHGAWEDVYAEARDGTIGFAGGALLVCPTPGMTVIDVDGALPPSALALAAVPAVAAAIGRMDLAGPLAIDFPTLPDKAARRAVDAALEQALAGHPHERTAMNGFGLVQIVSRQEGPSLVARIAANRVGAAARFLLARAERVEEPGVLLLSAHPRLRAAVTPAWEAELARRTGRRLRWHEDATLAPDAGFAQAVAA